MSRLSDIINEDREMKEEGRIDSFSHIVTLKLAQISSTLAMIYDLERERYRQEMRDDGR